LGVFAPHLQIKLSTHGSNLNSTYVIMNELNYFFVDKGLDSKLQHH
jgi:hypothetical protein